jgi:hypothetical protein
VDLRSVCSILANLVLILPDHIKAGTYKRNVRKCSVKGKKNSY